MSNNRVRITGWLLAIFLAACGKVEERRSVPGAGRMPRNELTQADASYIRSAFSTVDRFMDSDYYDSAQIWLNKIADKTTDSRPSLFRYYLTSRQMEVFYYNNLEQLGLQEAQRALRMATALKDPYLLADAHNFCGLFLVNRGKTAEAIAHFKKGIRLFSKVRNTGRDLQLSELHHLYGNAAEAYAKTGDADTAIVYAQQSLNAARQIGNGRGMANALLMIGDNMLTKSAVDEAATYFNRSRIQAQQSRDFDLELNGIGFLAECAALGSNKRQSLFWLQTGFGLMQENRQLNSFYALFFLERAAKVYRQYGEFQSLAQTLEMMAGIQKATQYRNNRQYRSILMTGLKNETRILNLEIAEANHEKKLATTKLYLLVLIVLLLAAAFIAYRYYTRQKLKLAFLRNRISQDLHDDIGGTLSGIALYSYITLEQNEKQQSEDVKKSLGIIGKNATDMVKRLNDIVWVVNPGHDSFESLLLRLEEYAVEMGVTKNIAVVMEHTKSTQEVKLSMDARKNIYLICKEAVNNAIKYSNCRQIRISAAVKGKTLQLRVQDDGVGFDRDHVKPQGNGLKNMEARSQELNGKLFLTSNAEGTVVELSCEITQ